MSKYTLLILGCFCSLVFAGQAAGMKDQPARVDLNSGAIQLRNGTQSLNELQSKQFIPLFIELESTNLERQNQIGTTEQAKLSNEPESIKINRTPDFVFENETFLKRITHALRIHSAPLAKAVGFLRNPSSNVRPTNTNVGMWRIADKEAYGLNFDGSGLVYFVLPGMSGFSGREPENTRRSLYKKRPLFSNEGKILISQYSKKAIIDHIINRAGMAEANYISIMDNQIVFEIKEPNIRYSNATNEVINVLKNTQAQSSENLLSTVWQPRTWVSNHRGY